MIAKYNRTPNEKKKKEIMTLKGKRESKFEASHPEESEGGDPELEATEAVMARTRNGPYLFPVRSAMPKGQLKYITAQWHPLLQDKKKRRPGPRFRIRTFWGWEGI